MRKISLSVKLVLVLVTVLSIGVVTASVGNAAPPSCTSITSLPYTINTSGSYCLQQNLSYSLTYNQAILINVDDVVLDLNGYKIEGSGGPAPAIYGNGRKNITVKNGTIRRFGYGIWLDDANPYTISRGNIITDIRSDANGIGFLVDGRGNIIRNNLLIDSGSNGIVSQGPGAQVIDNNVYDTYTANPIVPAIGIAMWHATGSVCEHNKITNDSLIMGSKGIDVDSGSGTASDILVENNRITAVYAAIVCSSGVTGKIRDNLMSGVTTTFLNGGSCIDAGNNN